MDTTNTTTAPTFPLRRTGGASWAIDGPRPQLGDQLVQGCGYSDATTTYEVIGEPMTTGYRGVWVRVRQVGGHHDGNTFGMHASYQGGRR